jgi:hypothetical protein
LPVTLAGAGKAAASLSPRKSLWADGPNGIDGWYDDVRLGPYYRQMKNYLINAVAEPSVMQKAGILGDIIAGEQDKFFKDDENTGPYGRLYDSIIPVLVVFLAAQNAFVKGIILTGLKD